MATVDVIRFKFFSLTYKTHASIDDPNNLDRLNGAVEQNAAAVQFIDRTKQTDLLITSPVLKSPGVLTTPARLVVKLLSKRTLTNVNCAAASLDAYRRIPEFLLKKVSSIRKAAVVYRTYVLIEASFQSWLSLSKNAQYFAVRVVLQFAIQFLPQFL
jgi:hypothetical protein